MSAERYDLVVLGGGPGGYATALRARAHGLSVALVEAAQMGGTCLHRGCVPSKAMLHVASVADQFRRLTAGKGPDPMLALGDADALHRIREDTVAALYRGLTGLLSQRGVTQVTGHGDVIEPGVVRVSGSSEYLAARHIVLATGSVPRALPALPFDGHTVVSSDQAVGLDYVPERALIVGGGAIGVEFASLWTSLGADVMVVEAADRLIPLEDADSSRALERAFRRRAIAVRTQTTVEHGSADGRQATVTLDDGTTCVADVVLVAVGRAPRTQGSGASELGLVDDRGYVQVDGFLRTAISGVWAVGDVIPTLALAHAAFTEGFLVADQIAGRPVQPIDYALVPRVTYCHPEVASVGLTETEARDRWGEGVRATTTATNGNARVLIEGGAGHVKTVTNPDGEVVGVHIVGPHATELIGEAGLAVAWGALPAEIAGVTHAHPTLSEALPESMLAAIGLPFHSHPAR